MISFHTSLCLDVVLGRFSQIQAGKQCLQDNRSNVKEQLHSLCWSWEEVAQFFSETKQIPVKKTTVYKQRQKAFFIEGHRIYNNIGPTYSHCLLQKKKGLCPRHMFDFFLSLNGLVSRKRLVVELDLGLVGCVLNVCRVF